MEAPVTSREVLLSLCFSEEPTQHRHRSTEQARLARVLGTGAVEEEVLCGPRTRPCLLLLLHLPTWTPCQGSTQSQSDHSIREKPVHLLREWPSE